MGITLRLTLRTSKPDKHGECPVAISIRGEGREMYHHTGIKAHPDCWVGGKIVAPARNHDMLNSRLETMLAEIHRKVLLLDMQEERPTPEQVKEMLSPDSGRQKDFIRFYRDYVDQLHSTGKKAPATIAVWEVEYRQFSEFANGRMPFKSVDHTTLDRYHRHIAAHTWADVAGQPQRYAPGTVFKKLKKLRQVVGLAVKRGFVDAAKVESFEMVKYVAPDKHYLTLEQTRRLADMLYRGDFDGDPALRVVAAFFLVECYGGIRISDWPHFEVEKMIDRRMFKVRAMKNKKYVYLDLERFPSLDRLLDYIKTNGLRFNLTGVHVNRVLKSVGALLGLSWPLCTHDGRRTFGTLLGELNYSTRFISQAMGISERTALGYIKVTPEGLAAEQQRLGGY